MTDIKLDEPVLDKDYPVYAGYYYVVNGKHVIECELYGFGSHQPTVRDLIRSLTGYGWNVEDIRRCDLTGRQNAPKELGLDRICSVMWPNGVKPEPKPEPKAKKQKGRLLRGGLM